MGTNRGKRSIVLDLKHADGRAALRKLLEDADVLMHNIRPQKLGAIGLDLAELRIRYPRLVVACLNGFSEQGPYGGPPAYDDIVQGMCGLAEGVASRTTREWLAVCDRLDIPAGPVNTLEQLFEDPHLRAVGFFQTVENADNAGAALLSSPGVRFNGALPKLRPACRLGQDTRQVLREAGLSEDEIAALLASRAAQAFTPPPAASPPGS